MVVSIAGVAYVALRDAAQPATGRAREQDAPDDVLAPEPELVAVVAEPEPVAEAVVVVEPEPEGEVEVAAAVVP